MVEDRRHEYLKRLPNVPAVYLIRNVITGRVYIGSTCMLRSRLLRHFSQLRNGTHCNTHLQRAWNLYGDRAFDVEVLEQFDSDDRLELRQSEEQWMQSYQCYDRTHGYNLDIRPCSASGKVSEETREKMRRASTGRTFTMSEQARRRISESQKGKQFSEEHRRKLSASLQGRTFSAESREKMSEAKSKSYRVVSPDGVELTVTNMRRFCRENSLSHTGMIALATGRWRYYKGWQCSHL